MFTTKNYLILEDCNLIKSQYAQILNHLIQTQFSAERTYFRHLISQLQQCLRQWRQRSIPGPIYQLSYQASMPDS